MIHYIHTTPTTQFEITYPKIICHTKTRTNSTCYYTTNPEEVTCKKCLAKLDA